MSWLILFLLTLIVFCFALKHKQLKWHYIYYGLLLSSSGFIIEFIGQHFDYWSTENVIFKIGYIPIFLFLTYFLAGILFRTFIPQKIFHQIIYLTLIIIFSILIEQALIKTGDVVWYKLNIFYCVLNHTIIILLLYGLFLFLKKFERQVPIL